MATDYKHRQSFIFDGKRYDIKAKSASELAVKVAMRKRDLEEGKKVISKNMPVEEWAEIYIETYRYPTVGELTYKDDVSINRVWIKPNIGTMMLGSVRPLHCQRILNSMQGYTKKHIKKVRIFMRAMFREALRNCLLIENPADDLKLPEAIDKSHRSITNAERKLLLKVCETNPHGLWIKIMLYCGLRPGETERIMGQHIDLKKKTLFIDGTKTKAAKREVPIPDHLIPALKERNCPPFEYLFLNRLGQPINKTNRRRMWESIKRSMNIEAGCVVFRNQVQPPYAVATDLVPYCMRHTYCTDLQVAGVPINIAKDLMGHESIEMTANIYTHKTEESFEMARKLINKNA